MADPAVGRINAAISPAREAVAAGHHVDQVERLDPFVWQCRDETTGLSDAASTDDAIAAALTTAVSQHGLIRSRAARGQALPPFRRQRHLQPDRATENVRRRVPSLFTSTPNSVPRSVTVAVGVRIEKRVE